MAEILIFKIGFRSELNFFDPSYFLKIGHGIYTVVRVIFSLSEVIISIYI